MTQIEVSFELVMEKMGQRIARSEMENAHLAAVNEVLTGRLQEYEQRDLQSKASRLPGQVNDQSQTGAMDHRSSNNGVGG